MILVDTSVWIQHFSLGLPKLSEELQDSKVLVHPFVIGELALGMLKDRTDTISLLNNLPFAVKAEDKEVMMVIEKNHLYSRGIGWVDVHLISSAILSHCFLWTNDKALSRVAKSLNILGI